MAIYEYRCERDGAFEVVRPIGTAPASVACPACEGESGRVYTAPLSPHALPRELVAALDHEEKTRESPDVVTSLPRAPRHQRTPVARMTPTLARLPRPQY